MAGAVAPEAQRETSNQNRSSVQPADSCRDALQAVHALHQQGWSHTDLKLANIMVSRLEDLEHLEVTVIDVGGSLVEGSGQCCIG